MADEQRLYEDTGVDGALEAKFLVPPFTVLDCRQGYWRARKQGWLDMGIQSEVGRGLDEQSGNLRGIVAAKLGRQYVGVDLRPEQVAANRDQAKALLRDTDPTPVWIQGDACQLHELYSGPAADFVFTCPPYFDLEVYSDRPNDLSNAGSYEALIEALIEAFVLVAESWARGIRTCWCPARRLDKYAPMWPLDHRLQLETALVPYSTRVAARLGGVLLDPVYEAKCVPFLAQGDLLWCVGIRDGLWEGTT